MNKIETAVNELKSGKLIGLPTETVYGLAAPINNDKLINRIFELKKRPFFDPLIVHISNVAQAKPLVKNWPDICDVLAEKFWPGPLTLVLEKTLEVNNLITSGLKTVGIRIPRCEIARNFITALGVPVAAPSANLFKKISPTCAEHVRSVFSSDDVFVLDGGACEVGIESTIIKICDNRLEILRPGVISSIQLSEVADRFSYKVIYSESSEVQSAGMLSEHYQPVKPLNVVCSKSLEQAKKTLNRRDTYWFHLSDKPEVAARQLYQRMREACEENYESCSIWIHEDYENDDLWRGIFDRLKKASTIYIRA